MYSIAPKGLNIRNNDRSVEDGYLQESINLQWRDGSLKPIPSRILTDINTSLYGRIILHKVGDEDQINVLGFTRTLTGLLAEDLSAYLGGGEDTLNGDLTWFGIILDGVYTENTTPQVLSVARTEGMSWTNMNGLLYFMGDGSEGLERFHKRIQYNESSEEYEEKDMYAWKSLIPFYPKESDILINCDSSAHRLSTRCGIICYRFALVLNSGEVVLHSPIYSSVIHSLNRSDDEIEKGAILDNIHTLIRLDLEFSDTALYEEEIAAINIYASVPKYYTEVPSDVSGETMKIIKDSELPDEIRSQSEEPFYLVTTIKDTRSEYLLLTVNNLDSDIVFFPTDTLVAVDYLEAKIGTIAAGEIMPVDNYSYHKLYGTLTNYNGRLVVVGPTTVLSSGCMNSLAIEETASSSAFEMDTEDGVINAIYAATNSVTFDTDSITSRGLLSYPDVRSNKIGAGDPSSLGVVRYFKSKGNSGHNMSCAYDFDSVVIKDTTVAFSGFLLLNLNYGTTFVYGEPDDVSGNYPETGIKLYDSKNRVQFSSIGEFSVWPAVNSYRVGDGKIMKVGANNVDQRSANIVSMLLVGTTDGIWSMNTDPTGNNFISSITRISRTNYISKEVLQIGSKYVFISDQGLMVTDGSSEPASLTKDFFPSQGDGVLPDADTIFPNYDALTTSYFSLGNIYTLTDIISYLKGSILAFDNRRNVIWCSNPDEEFSLVYDIGRKAWGMSTIVFAESVELFSSMVTDTVTVESWYLAVDNNSLQPYMLIMSGEDLETEVPIHMLSRPLKMKSEDTYKKIQRMACRCELYRNDVTETGYFSFGLWGKQDINKYKENIPLIALLDSSSFHDGIRQDIPIGSRKGKYKTLSILLGGEVLPDSSIDRFDINFKEVDNSLMR